MKYLLSQLKPGAQGIVERIIGDNEDEIYLLEYGLIPGSFIEVVRQAPFGDALLIKVHGLLVSIRASEAASIELQLL